MSKDKDLVAIIDYLKTEKGIDPAIVKDAIEESLRIAAQKSVKGAANVTVQVNPKTGAIDVFSEKEIVETAQNPAMQISLVEARDVDPDCEIGQFIDIISTPEDFGRIAAQKARQVIAQKLKSAEKDVIYEEYRHRVGELISGTVLRYIRGNRLIIDLGKVEAIMPMRNYPKTEQYHPGDKVFALLLDVREADHGGAEVILSRCHTDFVKQLFIQEVPEVSDGTVIIERLVREPGYRTKISVSATDSKVDPVGACVGMRGLRVKNIVRELNNEKIDIIPFSPEPLELLQNALDEIPIRKIRINEETNTMTIVVDDEEYPKAIGSRGMNARLNGQLIGFILEVKKFTEWRKKRAVEQAEISASTDPALDQDIDTIEGVNKLIFDQLCDDYKTPRTILSTKTEDLAANLNISLELAEHIIDEMMEKRTSAAAEESNSTNQNELENVEQNQE